MNDDLNSIINRAEMMENFAGDEELFHQIAEIFLDDVPQQLAALTTAHDAGDMDALRASAHKIKGSLASFAAKEAHAAAKALETACKEGSTANVSGLLATVMEQTKRLQSALRAELGR